MQLERFAALAAAALVAVAAVPLSAPSQGREIAGYVRAQGRLEAPPGTVISLELSGGGLLEETTPQGNGYFRFEALDKGAYYLVVRAPGYREASQRVEMLSGPRMSVHLTLLPNIPEPRQVPQLTLQAALVDLRTLRIPKQALKEFRRGSRKLFEDHDPAAALPHFQKATELFPEYYEAFHLLATTCMDLQQWPAAEAALKRSLNISNQYVPSLIALGALYNRQRRFADALPWLEKAEKLDPDSWLCHLELAQSLLPQKRIAEAEEHARLAHTKNPQFPLVHLALANVSLAKGELALGREESQHFLKLIPEGPLAEIVKGKVREIDALLAEQIAHGPSHIPPTGRCD